MKQLIEILKDFTLGIVFIMFLYFNKPVCPIFDAFDPLTHYQRRILCIPRIGEWWFYLIFALTITILIIIVRSRTKKTNNIEIAD
jgi:hypothetical protein